MSCRAREEQALAAAELGESLGQNGFVVRALHDVTRFGDPASAAKRLTRLADRVDGPFAHNAAAHAVALLQRDGDAVLEVAERFGAQDALLLAAEAADAAAAAYRTSGRDASARAATRRATAFLTACQDARPPTMQSEHVLADLTFREREVALLAAAGLSSRQIADQLVISTRTVDNHLQRTYRKLGITSRENLATHIKHASSRSR